MYAAHSLNLPIGTRLEMTMSKALSDLEDFFDGMVGDDEGFDVIAEAIEYVRMLEGENRHYQDNANRLSSILDKIEDLVS